MISEARVRCFKDIRDLIFGCTDEEWRAASRKLSQKFYKLELVFLCSALVKIVWSLVMQCVLPTLIDAVGIDRLLSAEARLRGRRRRGTSQGSQVDPSVCVSSFMKGVLAQIKEAMKQALMNFCSVKTPSESCRKTATAGEPPHDHSLIDHLASLSTKAIITEIVSLCFPDISHNPEQPLSFRQVINIIIKAMRHVHEVQRCSDVTDNERSTSSEEDEKNFFSRRIRTKATDAVSGILLEAREEISAAGWRHTGPLDEIVVTQSFVRVTPTASKITKMILNDLQKQPSSNQNSLCFLRNTLPVACKIYRDVQRNLYLFVHMVQTSISKEEKKLHVESAEREVQEVALGNGEDLLSKLASEGADVSLRNAVQVNGGSSLSRDKEELCLDMCTDEVIQTILTMYRTQAHYLTRDLIGSMLADVIANNVQIFHAEKKKPWRVWVSRFLGVPIKKLSRADKTYLHFAGVGMTQSFVKDLEEWVNESGYEIQTGIVRASIRSAFDYADIFAPFRLFRHVRNNVADIFFTVNQGRRTGVSSETVREDRRGFSRGFARRQAETANSSVNQMKSLLSSNSSTKRHEQAAANAISIVLRNMAGTDNLMRRFSESVPTEDRCSMFRACQTSVLVHSFVMKFVTRLARYFSSTGFLQIAVQTEFCKAETTSHDEYAVTVALRELTRTLEDFVEESTFRRSIRKTKLQYEPNAYNLKSQPATADDDVSCSSAQGFDGKRKKRKREKKRRITIHFTGKKTSKKNKTLKNTTCPSEHHQVKGDEVWFRETAAAALRRTIAAFFSPCQ